MTCSWSTGAASSLPSAGLVPLLHLSLTAGPTPRAQEQRGGERVPSGTPGIKLSERRTAHHPDGVTCSSTGCQRRPKGREQGSWAPHRTGTAPAWGGGLEKGTQNPESRAESRGTPRANSSHQRGSRRGREQGGMEWFKEDTGSYNWRHFYSLTFV